MNLAAKSRKASTMRSNRLSIEALSSVPAGDFVSLGKGSEQLSMSSSASMPNTSSVLSNRQLVMETNIEAGDALESNSPCIGSTTAVGSAVGSGSDSQLMEIALHISTDQGLSMSTSPAPSTGTSKSDGGAGSLVRVSRADFVLVDDVEDQEVSSVTSSRPEDPDGDSSSYASAEDIATDRLDEDSECNISLAALSDDMEMRMSQHRIQSRQHYRYQGDDTGSRSSGSVTGMRHQRRNPSGGPCDSSRTPSPLVSDDDDVNSVETMSGNLNASVSRGKGGTLTPGQVLQPAEENEEEVALAAAANADVVDDSEPTLMASCENLTAEESPDALTVLAPGGQRQGWNGDSAVVLWRRMLGCLGDINLINDAGILYEVYRYLTRLTDTLLRIRSNQGVPSEPQSNAAVRSPGLVPPVTLIVPWLFNVSLHTFFTYVN